MTATTFREDLLHARHPADHPAQGRTAKCRPACDFRRYKDRNQIERMFNRLKQSRRIATRYDKTA